MSPSPSPPLAPTRPADLARWAFWVPLRRAVHPTRPRMMRALYTGWRAQYLAAGAGRALMDDEYTRWFGDAYSPSGRAALVRDAYRAAFRTHMDELLLGRLNRVTVDRYIQFEGWHHLEAALAQGKGVVWAYPHAGSIMLMLAGLALRGVPYTQYAARGLAPEDIARDHPELLASNRWREAVRATREADEDRLPAKFLTLAAPTRTLVRRLADGEVVGLAYDGRIGTKWVPVDYLGRTALLNPGPYRLAALAGAPIVPAFCHTPARGPAVCQIGAPIQPDAAPPVLMRRFLDRQEAWLRRHPADYGIWLLHARQRNHIDDHPLFVDHAADQRFRRWMPA